MKEILKFLRQQNGYSQSQIAEKIGVTRQTYIKYEKDELEPTVQTIRSLSDFYNVEYSVLIDNHIPGTEGRQNPPETEYKFSDEHYAGVAEPAVSYGIKGDSKTVTLPESEYSLIKAESEKMKISLQAFIKLAVTELIKSNKKQDTLDQWQPLNLGKMLSDYADKSYQAEMMDEHYDGASYD